MNFQTNSTLLNKITLKSPKPMKLFQDSAVSDNDNNGVSGNNQCVNHYIPIEEVFYFLVIINVIYTVIFVYGLIRFSKHYTCTMKS